jgi:hypothetical protein
MSQDHPVMPLLRSFNLQIPAQCFKYFVPTGLSERVYAAAAVKCNLLEVLQSKSL